MLKNELTLLKSGIGTIPTSITTAFDVLEKIKTDFEIKDIYKLEEKMEHGQNLKNVSVPELDELLNTIESLKSIDKKQVNVSNIYDKLSKRCEEIGKAIESINKLIVVKNTNITDFKNKYSKCRNKIKNVRITSRHCAI